MTAQKDWQPYFEATKLLPPSPTLVKALAYVAGVGRAIDIGAGALKDTRYLLSQGFTVTAMDKDDALADMVKELESAHVDGHVEAFEHFDFPARTYVLAHAGNALPFASPDMFEAVFEKVWDSLVPGGIFCGQFFGNRHEWSSNPAMSFQTEPEARRLLRQMDVLAFDEVERDGKTKLGVPAHWHAFNIIARKR